MAIKIKTQYTNKTTDFNSVQGLLNNNDAITIVVDKDGSLILENQPVFLGYHGEGLVRAINFNLKNLDWGRLGIVADGDEEKHLHQFYTPALIFKNEDYLPKLYPMGWEDETSEQHSCASALIPFEFLKNITEHEILFGLKENKEGDNDEDSGNIIDDDTCTEVFITGVFNGAVLPSSFYEYKEAHVCATSAQDFALKKPIMQLTYNKKTLNFIDGTNTVLGYRGDSLITDIEISIPEDLVGNTSEYKILFYCVENPERSVFISVENPTSEKKRIRGWVPQEVTSIDGVWQIGLSFKANEEGQAYTPFIQSKVLKTFLKSWEKTAPINDQEVFDNTLIEYSGDFEYPSAAKVSSGEVENGVLDFGTYNRTVTDDSLFVDTIKLNGQSFPIDATTIKGVGVEKIALLDDNNLIPAENLVYAKDVFEYSLTNPIETPEEEKVYINTDTNEMHRWNGSEYVKIGLELGVTEDTAYSGLSGNENRENINAINQNILEIDEEIETIKTSINEEMEAIKETIDDIQNSVTDVAQSSTNGNILVDGSEIKVYDDTELTNTINNKITKGLTINDYILSDRDIVICATRIPIESSNLTKTVKKGFDEVTNSISEIQKNVYTKTEIDGFNYATEEFVSETINNTMGPDSAYTKEEADEKFISINTTESLSEQTPSQLIYAVVDKDEEENTSETTLVFGSNSENNNAYSLKYKNTADEKNFYLNYSTKDGEAPVLWIENNKVCVSETEPTEETQVVPKSYVDARVNNSNLQDGTGGGSSQMKSALSCGVRSFSEGAAKKRFGEDGKTYNFEVKYKLSDNLETLLTEDELLFDKEDTGGSGGGSSEPSLETTTQYLDGTLLKTLNAIEFGSTGAYGTNSHSEGYWTLAGGPQSHTEGSHNYATKKISTIEGYNAHVEGTQNYARGAASHAEGSHNIVKAPDAHVEGMANVVIGKASHAEGLGNRVDGIHSHSEGVANIIFSGASHAEGYYNAIEKGANSSHVEGSSNIIKAGHYNSHVGGLGNFTSAPNQTIVGTYAEYAPDALFIVGCGKRSETPTTGFKVLDDGRAQVWKGPETDNDVTTKKYVDDLVGNIKSLLEAI